MELYYLLTETTVFGVKLWVALLIGWLLYCSYRDWPKR